jgi:alanyl-tRNA synthetase
VRTDRSGHRYLVTSDPDLDVSGLPTQAQRLAADLDATVVLLLPDAAAGSMRVGVGVPAGLTGQVPATGVLNRVLAVTGGHGGGSPAFAQGGGATAGDPSDIEHRIRAALDLEPGREPRLPAGCRT